MKKIVFIILIVLLLIRFVPIIPYNYTVLGLNPERKGVETIKEFIYSKMMDVYYKKYETDMKKYGGYYENSLDPKINLTLLENFVFSFKTPIFNFSFDEYNARWGLTYKFIYIKKPIINIRFSDGIKNGFSKDELEVAFKISDNDEKITVEQSDIQDQIPVGLVLEKK